MLAAGLEIALRNYENMAGGREMTFRGMRVASAVLIGCVGLSACGNSGFGSGGFGGRTAASDPGAFEDPQGPGYQPVNPGTDQLTPVTDQGIGGRRSRLFDLFTNRDDPNTTVEVNKYLWFAARDVLNFLPVETADPFSGVLVTGYGAPPGGGRAYRATVYVQDPALDARSLKLSLQTRGGPASPDTVRAVEDAIMTRARQLRIRDGNL
jgi:hypothetical protein